MHAPKARISTAQCCHPVHWAFSFFIPLACHIACIEIACSGSILLALYCWLTVHGALVWQRNRKLIRRLSFALADEECRALVGRILASPEFQRAARLRAFLNYVVEKKLAGTPEDVTETLIGHRVFRRPATYNPGDDSIVGTEARTLRQRLERYFAAAGADEPVILEIPRGHLPVFRPRRVTAPGSGKADARDRPADGFG